MLGPLTLPGKLLRLEGCWLSRISLKHSSQTIWWPPHEFILMCLFHMYMSCQDAGRPMEIVTSNEWWENPTLQANYFSIWFSILGRYVPSSAVCPWTGMGWSNVMSMLISSICSVGSSKWKESHARSRRDGKSAKPAATVCTPLKLSTAGRNLWLCTINRCNLRILCPAAWEHVHSSLCGPYLLASNCEQEWSCVLNGSTTPECHS